jgi:hypothetical protein
VNRAALLCLAVLLPASGCTDTPPDDRAGLLQPPGTVPWQDALVLPGDPTLVTVRFVAGPEGPPSDRCADRFEIEADETRDRVELTVREVPKASPAAGTDVACSLAGVQRYATADLDRPIGTRRVVDGSREEDRPLVDGSRDRARAAVRAELADPGDAQVAGTLGIDAASGCLWVETTTGRSPVLLAHPRYSVRLDSTPPVVAEDGGAPAAAGQQVRLAGAAGTAADAVPGCSIPGPPFVGVLQR